MFMYLIAISAAFISRRMPSRSIHFFAAVLASILYIIWPRARHNAQDNMRLVLGPGASRIRVRRASWGAFRNYARYCIEFLRDNSRYEDRVSLSGIEHIDEALKDGKGAILVSLHMGSWDLAALAVARRRYKLNVVVDNVCNDKVNRWIQRMRAKVGARVIAAKDSMPSLFRALRRNEVLAMLIDCPALGNVKVRFFGARAKVPGGPAALALRTGAKIVPGVMVRTRGNRFKTLIAKPLSFEPTGDFAQDVQALTQQIMESLEGMVKEYPDQWFMFRRIWVQ
ncbi:MAG: lysophospholipid acyltransferase family protein [Chloroflexi bacterium]|nr:lysophospholipid acyltransferase family protein [Chloroflexota bacterium]